MQRTVIAYASRGAKGKSTKAVFRVISQLSPWDLGTRRRKPGESNESPSVLENSFQFLWPWHPNGLALQGRIASGSSAIWMAPADQQPAARTGANEYRCRGVGPCCRKASRWSAGA